MYECPSCGAGLIFDPTTQKLKCHYCNQQFEMQELEKLKSAKGEKDLKIEATNEEQAQTNVYEAIVYRCTQCGAELITTDETISTFCSYCGSSAVLEKKDTKKAKPDYIIPFTKTKEECEEAYKKILSKAFFAPSNMADEQQVEKIRGIYMPYWIYSYEKDGPDVSTGEKYKCRRGDYVYYTDYNLTTNIKAKCSGITHDASANFSDSLSEGIAPFSIKEKKEFDPAYLSGFYADSEDVESGVYVEKGREIASDDFSRQLMKDRTYAKYNSKANVSILPKKTEMGLFPVYFLATKNKTGDRISYAVVNGQTGKVAAEIPIDFKKYLITSLILAIPIFLLLNATVTLTPIKVLITAIVFSIISLIMISKQFKQIEKREKRLEDLGYASKAKIKIKKETKRKGVNVISNLFSTIIIINIIIAMSTTFFSLSKKPTSAIIVIILMFFMLFPIILKIRGRSKKDNIEEVQQYEEAEKTKKSKEIDKELRTKRITRIIKPIMGVISCIVILIINPVSDIYYYSAAVLSIAMVILSFWDIVKGINLLTTRKLPQLEKRGGDERE